jgi:hypothetical protein
MGTSVFLSTSRQGAGINYRLVVDRAVRSVFGDVLTQTQTDFIGYTRP